MKRYLFLIYTGLIFIISLNTVYANDIQNKTGSITINTKYKEEDVIGGNLIIYKIAEKNDDSNFVLTKDFANSKINLDKDTFEKNQKEYAKTLFENAKNLNPFFKIDKIESGEIKISDLKQGIYLITQTKVSNGYEIMAPFLVTIPYNDEFDIEVFEKISPKKTENKKIVVPDKKKEDKKLPDTGHVWWPVYTLIILGTFLFSLSFVKMRGKNEN